MVLFFHAQLSLSSLVISLFHCSSVLSERTSKFVHLHREIEPTVYSEAIKEIAAKVPFLSGEGNNISDVRGIATIRDINGDFDEKWTCLEKVVLEEEIQWDYEERCHHVTTQNCYQAFKTVFKPQKVEVCDEKFRKDCFITYKDLVKSEVVQVCDEELKRDCDASGGQEVCSTQYETVCETRYKEFEIEEDLANCEVRKVEWCKPDPVTGEKTFHCINVPKTVCNPTTETTRKVIPHVDCNSKPKEVCGPETCPIVKGERKCRNEKRHLIQEVPEEECNMIPQRSCTEEVKIVPSLVPVEKCEDVPKEICTTARVNPTKVKKPVVKKWCGPVLEYNKATPCSGLCLPDNGLPNLDQGLLNDCRNRYDCASRCGVLYGGPSSPFSSLCRSCAAAGCDGFVSNAICVAFLGGECPAREEVRVAAGNAEAKACPNFCDEDSADGCRETCSVCTNRPDIEGLCRRCYAAGCDSINLLEECITIGGCLL